MQWEGREESGNVEDRRGMSPRAGMMMGGGGGAILILILGLIFGPNIANLLQQQPGPEPSGHSTKPDDEQTKFLKVVLKDTEDVWTKQFKDQLGEDYQEPTLVIFEGRVNSACGQADSSVGPFYCPADKKVYIDPSFFKELQGRLGASGDFAQAYVLAHEVGHHVQNLRGWTKKVDSQRGKISEKEMNKLSVRLELQADYLAGVWAHHIQKTKKVLEPGDIEEALNAANAVGDDRLAKMAGSKVIPERFTHGRSDQRVKWFREGFKSGSIKKGDELFKMSYDDL